NRCGRRSDEPPGLGRRSEASRCGRRSDEPPGVGGGVMTAERLSRARRVLEIEGAGLAALRDRLGLEFARAIDVLLGCRGKVIVTGVGKSGIVCRKIAATFSSTGTPAFFLHAVEGGHGDLGTLVRGDVLLAVSNSGETEVVNLLPVARRFAI